MAITRLSNLTAAQRKFYSALISERHTDVSKLRQTGIIASDPLMEERARGEGFETTIRSWAPLYLGNTPAESADDSDTDVTPRNVSARNLTARRYHRTLAYKMADITRDAYGADANDYAAGELGRLWNDDEEMLVMAMLKSIEASDAARDADKKFVKSFVKSTSGAVAEADQGKHFLSAQNVMQAKNMLGDAADSITTIFVHSDVFTNAQVREINSFVPVSKTDVQIYRWFNTYNVIVSDRLRPDRTDATKPVYTNYAFGAGMFKAGNGGSEFVTVNDELKGKGWGQETIISRSSFVLHPQGFNCAAVPANGVSLTNAEVEVDTAFSLVAERKSVPLVIVKTNG